MKKIVTRKVEREKVKAKKQKPKAVSIYFDAEYLKQIDEAAARGSQRRNEFIKYAIRQAMENELRFDEVQ